MEDCSVCRLLRELRKVVHGAPSYQALQGHLSGQERKLVFESLLFLVERASHKGAVKWKGGGTA